MFPRAGPSPRALTAGRAGPSGGSGEVEDFLLAGADGWDHRLLQISVRFRVPVCRKMGLKEKEAGLSKCRQWMVSGGRSQEVMSKMEKED